MLHSICRLSLAYLARSILPTAVSLKAFARFDDGVLHRLVHVLTGD